MPEPCDETPRLVVISVKVPVDAPAAGVDIIGTFDEWAGTAMIVGEEAGWYYTVLSDVTECDEFKFREADFGHYPKGLMYGLQALDSWLYDEDEPFMHIEENDTFVFLRERIVGELDIA